MAIVRRFNVTRKRSLGLLVVFLILTLAASALPAQATNPPSNACALTPSLLGGQGFSFSGQGFSFSGQGFSFSGQGFSFSGQGFSLSEVGLDPNTVAQQVLDNQITVGKWVTDRLPFFQNRLGFNSDPTAILIVDEFNTPDAHGFEVQKVVQDSIAAVKALVPTLKIDTFPIDVSDPSTNYDANIITSKISAKVDSLKPTYKHFVLNMSFGLIECNDPGTSGTPAFNFNDAVNTVKANNAATPTLGIVPVLDCVMVKKDDDHHGGYGDWEDYHFTHKGFIAFFGYKNANGQLISVPISDQNKFTSPSPFKDRGQPTQFEPGQQHAVFAIPTFESSLTWTLTGPDGQAHSVTATASSTPCAPVFPQPWQKVTPVLECVSNEGGGVYKAHFGYKDVDLVGIRIPPSIFDNKFSPGPADRGQVTTFIPGTHTSVFEVAFDGSNLNWKLNGTTVTANSSSPGCSEEKGYGMNQYLTQNLGVPQNQVDTYWQNLTSKAADDQSLQGLRNLLKTYAQTSATPGSNFTLVAVASSGNYKAWLGAAPLAPAVWPETIAVGATLDDTNNIWQPFSEDANLLAPGAGYPFGNNNFGAGTSFSAPAFSVLAAMCSTSPTAVKFDGKNAPLTGTVLNSQGQKNLSNSPLGLDDLSPFNCKPNRPPTIDLIPPQSNPAGTSVSLQVSAHDPDGDTLSYSAMGLPPGLSIGASTGLISGTIGASASGPYNATVTVKDSGTPQGSATTSFVWTVTPPPVLHVNIDIKPLSSQNRINLHSWGIVPVAILGSATFNATTVNPLTVKLAGAPVIIFHYLPSAVQVDINHDGYTDLVVSVRVQDLQLDSSSTSATLTGKTYGGQAIEGSDFVKIVPPHAPHDLSPYSGTTWNDHTVTLTWEPVDEEDQANTCYQIAIANSASFNHMIQTATVTSAPNYTAFQLSNGTYFWHVAVSDCAGNAISPWSDTWTVTIHGH